MCNYITSVVIPDSVTVIDTYAFETCNYLTDIYLGTGVTNINFNAFWTSSVTPPRRNLYITDLSAYCQIVNADSKLYNYNLYLNNSLVENLVIPSDVVNIGDFAFYGCRITSLTIPSTVRTIGGWAFYRCGITSLTISEGVTEIGPNAFSANGSLTGELHLPSTLQTLGRNAFEDCAELTSIIVESGVIG